MSTYNEIEQAVLDVIRTHDDFTPDNSLTGDLEGLKRGFDRLVRVMYGGLGRRALTVTMMEHTWTVRVDVFVPYRGRIQEMEARLATERQKIVDTLAKYPKLNSLTGIISAEVLNAETPEPLGSKKTAYRGQRLYLSIRQAVDPVRVG